MQLIAVAIAFFAATVAVEASPTGGQKIFYCGSQPYKKTQYTCYPKNNFLLCPIQSGVVYLPCGVACYDPAKYGCAKGKLVQHGTGPKCAGVSFNPNTHVCVGGELCPTTHPNRCSMDCYDLAQYWCDNGTLKQVGQP